MQSSVENFTNQSEAFTKATKEIKDMSGISKSRMGNMAIEAMLKRDPSFEINELEDIAKG